MGDLPHVSLSRLRAIYEALLGGARVGLAVPRHFRRFTLRQLLPYYCRR